MTVTAVRLVESLHRTSYSGSDVYGERRYKIESLDAENEKLPRVLLLSGSPKFTFTLAARRSARSCCTATKVA